MLMLQKKLNIWALNIGENYEISISTWRKFTDCLPSTNITHLYVSEHVIPIELKNKMREYIRENRRKHTNHCSFKNIHVIEKVTNMWWYVLLLFFLFRTLSFSFSFVLSFSLCSSCRNPINGVKEIKPKVAQQPTRSPRATIQDLSKCPQSTAYWQEGVGKGGDKPWKFNCKCGEVCSSYENFRYQPIGRMYECSRCNIWSHVDCVLGPSTPDEDLEEIIDLMCYGCQSRVSRLQRYWGDDWQQHDDRSDIYELTAKDLVNIRKENAKNAKKAKQLFQEKARITSHPPLSEDQPKKKLKLDSNLSLSSFASSSSLSNTTTEKKPKKQLIKKKKNKLTEQKKKAEEEEEPTETDEDETDGNWRFKCICGETCSWYEDPLYRPTGRKYQCSNCEIWSHVECMFSESTTDKQLHEMKVSYFPSLFFFLL
jgi:hypothetical protein